MIWMRVLGCGWPESVRIRRADFITVNTASHLGHTSYHRSNALPAVSNGKKDSCDNALGQPLYRRRYINHSPVSIQNSFLTSSLKILLFMDVLRGTHCVLNVRNELPAYIILQKWPFSIERYFICHAGKMNCT